VSGGKQLENQGSSKNSGGASNGYSQSFAPGFIFMLLILNVPGSATFAQAHKYR
jgi:hypothetical protein